MALGKRVKSRREQLNMSQEELGEAIGVTSAGISALETRDSRSSRQLSKLAKALKTTETWLETGITTEAHTVLEDAGSYNVRNDPSGDDVLIPQYKDIAIAAGHGSHIDTETITSALAFKRGWLNKKGYKENNLVVVYARGDSMSPRISDGDVLLVKTDENHNILDGKVYAINYAGEAKVKRLSKRFDGSIIVSSDNQSTHYRDEIIPTEQIEQLKIIGRVVWIGGDM